MQKKIVDVDKKKGIVQITIADERWYVKDAKNATTGLPEFEYVPSVTWITSFYPKGVEFYKWLASKGWDESQAIKQAAGDKGSKVHEAIVDLLANKPVPMEAKYPNKSTGQQEELTLEEYECLMAFALWFKENKPRIIASEIVVWNAEHNYAGTVDFIAQIGEEFYIIDFKTGQYVWPEYELQISAYKHASYKGDDAIIGLPDDVNFKLAILQLGYRRNKSGYKFTEIEDKFPLFLSAQSIWKNETEGVEPSKKDYPLVLTLSEEKPAKKKGRITNSKQTENHA